MYRYRSLVAATIMVALLSPLPALAKEPPAAPPPTAAELDQLLATLQDGPASARAAAAATLAAVTRAPSVPRLVEFLARTRKSTDADRRAVLKSINAPVPDKKGKFRAPGREKATKVQADDDFDWLAKLVELAPTPGLGDVIADVAVVRALAASRSSTGGTAIFDFAFTDAGLLVRDECGRYLRKMSPYSLPALIRAAEIRKKYSSKRRYATYQLERLDRENPDKALRAAGGDPQLQADIFAAWRDTKARWPVVVVLRYLDHVSPLVRAAARESWMALVTGKPPPDPPMRKLQRPGGELSKKEMPLWFNSRQLAQLELYRELERLYGEAPDKKQGLEELSKKLFAYYDDRRKAASKQLLSDGLALAADKKWAEAVAVFDRILVQIPQHPARADMAPAYLGQARALEKDERWREAAIAYRKAHDLGPEQAHSDLALAAHHHALGRALNSEGGDGSAELRRADAINPDHSTALANGGGGAGNRQWMLFAGAGAGGLALLLLVIGLIRRR